MSKDNESAPVAIVEQVDEKPRIDWASPKQNSYALSLALTVLERKGVIVLPDRDPETGRLTFTRTLVSGIIEGLKPLAEDGEAEAAAA